MRTIRFDSAKFRMEDSGAWLMLRVPAQYRQPARAFVQEIKPDRLYDAKIRQHREKRSMDANAYFWVLCGRLAAMTGIPKEEIYRDYVRQIGDNFEVLPIRNDAVKRWKINWESRGDGWPCESLGPSKLTGYTNMACYYGSSTYDIAQMSRLIDLVVYDCKEQDIETETPDEIARMVKEWGE